MTQPTTTSVTTTVYQCVDCDAISEAAGGPLYECGNCSTKFNADASNNGNHQCPDCNKFAAKVAEMSCQECNHGEVEEHEGIQCTCHDEWHLVD